MLRGHTQSAMVRRPATSDVKAAPATPTKRPILWYPLGLSAAYLAHLYLETGVHPAAAARSVVVVLVATALVQLVLTLFLRDRDRGALATAGLLVLITAAHPVERALVGLALLAVVAGLMAWIIHRGRSLDRISWILQSFTAVLLVVSVVRFAFTPLPGQMARDLLPPQGASAAPADPGDPDIVGVLLDGYPGAASLDRVFDLDDELADALRERGFEVAAHARSNYSQTVLTLASMFNFGLLDQLPETRDSVAAGRFPRPLLRGLVNDSAMSRLLRERGNRIMATASGWEDSAFRSADVFLDQGELNEFEIALLRSTAAWDLLRLTGWDLVGDQQRARVHGNLDQLRAIAEGMGDQPTFAFVHVPAPHAPIVFDAQGGPVPVDLRTPYDYGTGLVGSELIRTRYREQLQYLDRSFIEALDDALAALPKDAVVVVFADHGPRSRLDATDDLRLQEAVDILLAVRAPGRTGLLPDDTTLVNVLPAVFDAYLGTSLPRSADHSFVSGEVDLLPFVEVPARSPTP